MAEELSDFLKAPSGETFVRLRALVLADPSYDFYSTGIEGLARLDEAGDHAAVVAALAELMPNWLLSPRAHLLAARAAERAGDASAARREHYFARACMRGLLESGAGTPERPYLVTHIADEYDVLEQRRTAPTGQRRVMSDAGVFDVLTCADGAEIWFDVGAGLKARP